MDRRSFVVSFAGLSIAAGSAFAQKDTKAAMGPMEEAEKKHILDTLQVGTMSLEASPCRWSRQGSERQAIREFRSRRAVDRRGNSEAAGRERPAGRSHAGRLDEEARGAGGDFDRAYVQAEIEGHNKLLQVQEAYIAVGQNQSEVDIAKLVRGMIKEHLTLLADIDKGGMRG